MKKLILDRKDAEIMIAKEQFTLTRLVRPRGKSREETIAASYPVGAVFWVAEPVYVAKGPDGELKTMYTANPKPEGWMQVSLPRKGYRVGRHLARYLAEVVAVGEIEQMKWSEVAFVDVTFKRVEKCNA